MTAPIYHLPGRKNATREDARAAGIEYALDGCVVRHANTGPADVEGVFIANDKKIAAGRVGYFPDRQTWRRIPGSEVWLGWYTAEPPGPEDLLRPDAVDGLPVETLAGHRWMVPLARGYADTPGNAGWYCALPQTLVRDDEGQWTAGEVVAKYRPLWDTACRWQDARDGVQPGEDGQAMVTFDNVIAAAVAVLAVNYHLSTAEVDLLGLLTTFEPARILDAAIDFEKQLEFAKKNAGQPPENSSSDAGGPDSQENTCQH